MLQEASQQFQEDGERGFVSLRAFDSGLKRPTVRTGECVITHGRVAEPIIAVPSALGTVDGRWSTANTVTVAGESVCFQKVQSAAITELPNDPAEAPLFGQRPKYLDLRLAEIPKDEVQTSDAERKVVSRPTKSMVSPSWDAVENMLKSNSGLKLNRGNFDQDSEEEVDEDVEEDEESHGDPLELMMRKAMERMMNPSGASSSNAVPRHGSAIGRQSALRRAPGGGGSRDDGHAAQEPDLNTMVSCC